MAFLSFTALLIPLLELIVNAYSRLSHFLYIVLQYDYMNSDLL